MSDAATAQKEWFGHPRGLATLFFTELWERFSYYGMRGILVLFMVATIKEGGFAMNEKVATAIYGLYTAGVYLLALPGGWIADNILGQRRAVFWGGVIIAAGHFSMAVPTVFTFYAGLALIVIGTGLLKPNVSAMVGDLYPEKGARRDAGFSVFYMGINLGAFLGPVVCGYLGEKIDWHLGFSAAGIGMVLGLIQYSYGTRHLRGAGELKEEAVPRVRRSWGKLFAGFGGVAVVAFVLAGLQLGGVVELSLQGVAQATGVVIVSLAILYFGYVLFFGGLTTLEKKRVLVIFSLFLGAALFWSGFEQAGSSMNIFAERLTDLSVLGWEMPASWLQSVNPIFIIAFAPFFGWLWVWLAHREPSIPMKFFYGLALLGTGFLVLAWGATYTQNGTLVSPMWLIVTYLLHTFGELCLSPVGLSSVTKLAPERLVGQMMGTWFMGAALGNLVAGLVAGQIADMPMPQLFGSVAIFCIGAGFLFFIFSPLIKKAIGDPNL
jgi:POT family proton-dependent oligopeptide transporter